MKKNKKMHQKLEQYRQTALSQMNPYLIERFLPLFTNLDQESSVESEDIQYLQEFDKMQQLEPNEEGTGRITLTNQRKTIGIVNLSLEKSLNLLQIKKWVSSYFGVTVKVLNLNLALYYGKKKYYIYDKNNQLDYELEKNNKDIINVMSIFDVLVQFLPKNICSMVASIDQDIFDPSSPDNYIVGRACGDRVCVVQYSDDKEEFYGTIIHELLHTFGFDHCYLWDCIMNENVSGSMQLCLHDLEKLQLVNPFNYLKRYKDIYKISKSIGLTKECEWLQNMIDEIQKPRRHE